MTGAALLLGGGTEQAIVRSFSGARFAPAPLSGPQRAVFGRLAGHTLDHPHMPDAVRLEVPDWLMPVLAERFGAALPAEAAALLTQAPLDLRVNLLRVGREEARAALAQEGIAAQPTPLSPWGLRVAGRPPVTGGAAFRSGRRNADEGSQIVTALVDARPGMRVVDYCAGAGGKALALAMTMRNQGQLLACDVSARRLDAATRRLHRAGAYNVERHLLVPGDKWAKRRADGFDRVLVDVPCTGTGTWRRNPDARLRVTPCDLAELVAKQASILDRAAKLVRIGGKMIYATCSVAPKENEAQVSAFLARSSNFALVPLARAWQLDPPLPCDGPLLRLTPLRHNTDAFFAAVLERVE